jgi:hypothetical protein
LATKCSYCDSLTLSRVEGACRESLNCRQTQCLGIESFPGEGNGAPVEVSGDLAWGLCGCVDAWRLSAAPSHIVCSMAFIDKTRCSTPFCGLRRGDPPS